MESYSKKVGAEFNSCVGLSGYEDPNYVKFEINELLDDYDRVLFLDCDVVISDDAPNIFDVVPDDKLGVYVESVDVPERIEQTEFVWNKNKLEHDGCRFMFNAGVMLFSQCHRDLIKLPPEHIKAKDLLRFKEQIWFNYIFRNADIHRLGHEWNHMDLSQKPDDDNVYFRHYAASDRKKLLKIIEDLKGE